MKSRALLLLILLSCCAAAHAQEPIWLAPMKQVHAKFTGKPGTFAQFGDSITVTMAYWSPLRYEHKNLNAPGQKAFGLVNSYMLKDCWDKWKGPDFGSNGSMTIRWADENVDRWLKKLNPEVVLIMFGTNDINQLKIDEYESKTRGVVKRCLDNGAIVILSTIPPRSGKLKESKQFAELAKEIAADMKLPLVDYFGECLKRRPDDWDGTLPKFNDGNKDVYDVPTLISKDGVHPSNPKQFSGDYSDNGLRSNGFALRNYLTLLAYAETGAALGPQKLLLDGEGLQPEGARVHFPQFIRVLDHQYEGRRFHRREPLSDISSWRYLTRLTGRARLRPSCVRSRRERSQADGAECTTDGLVATA